MHSNLAKSENFFIALNWKMNLTYFESESLLNNIVNFCSYGSKITKGNLIILPQIAALSSLAKKHEDLKKIFFGAQNIHYEDFGAYTGETSAKLLRSINCNYALVGHSERRLMDGANLNINNRLVKCIENNLMPILCVGENFQARDSKNHITFVKNQLDEALTNIQIEELLIAYEPIWAIGTGVIADNLQISEMVGEIRDYIATHYRDSVKSTYFLYGGSCNEKNFSEILSNTNIDGFLIGGASLDFDKIKIIIEQTLF